MLMTDSQQALREANHFLGETVGWQLMPLQGDANPVYWGRSRHGKLVLRLLAGAERAFGASRQRESAILQQIQAYAWAPELLCYSAGHRWCLMAHHGVSLDQLDSRPGEELVQPESRYHRQLLEAVRDMQGISTAPAFDYQALFASYRDLFLHHHMTAELLSLQRLQGLVQQLPAEPRCLVHHDLHQGNFCLDHEQLIILDWEYAGHGNPWLDMAALSRFHDIPVEQLSRLPVCSGLGKDLIDSYLGIAMEAIRLLELIWEAARR